MAWAKRDGQPCRARATAGGACIGHAPGTADARSKGGHATSKAVRAQRLLPARLRPVFEALGALVALREALEKREMAARSRYE